MLLFREREREREVRCVEVEDKDAEPLRDRGEEKGFECYSYRDIGGGLNKENDY
jgi:hypothetical protein